MATFAPKEVHIPIDGQTDITITHPYVVGSGDLEVFLNGILAVINIEGEERDYYEVDEYTIRFNYQLSSEDVVITKHQVYFDDLKVSVIGELGESLFQKYGNEDRLFSNQKYTMQLQYGEQTIASSFLSEISPLYSTVETIRGDLTELVRLISDEAILIKIYQNSILAMNTATEEILDDLNDPTTKVPYFVKQYVRYQTDIDFLIQIYTTMSGSAGSESKKLGELEISRYVKLGEVKDMLVEWKKKLKPWENQLIGGARSPLVSAVRGGTSNPYPLTTPRRGE